VPKRQTSGTTTGVGDSACGVGVLVSGVGELAVCVVEAVGATGEGGTSAGVDVGGSDVTEACVTVGLGTIGVGEGTSVGDAGEGTDVAETSADGCAGVPVAAPQAASSPNASTESRANRLWLVTLSQR
jgi:hypothetical protein